MPQSNAFKFANNILTNGGYDAADLVGAAGGVNTPNFSVYRSTSDQIISSGSWTKIQFNAENFDTGNCFDSTTNYRFTPNVAGKYQFNINVVITGTSVTFVAIAIYKNGNQAFVTSHMNNTQNDIFTGGSTVLEANGSSDYFEGFGYMNATSPKFANSTFTLFNGYKIIE